MNTVVCCLALWVVASAHAQTPTWRVTIKPAVNPLPIGNCGNVYVAIDDASTRTSARNRLGQYVSIADFDMAASASDPRAVIGVWDTPTAWAVCGCQGATIGQPVTISATYPAKALDPRRLVPGVSIQQSITISLAKAPGTLNPPGCSQLSTTIAARAGTTAIGGTPQQLVGGGAGSPTGVAVTGAFLATRVTWSATPNALRYSVLRSQVPAPAILLGGGALTATQLDDSLPDPRSTYSYVVVAYFANGRSLASAPVSYTPPPLVNPTGFTAMLYRQSSPKTASMRFEWNAVPGVVAYRVTGTGLPATGVTSTTLKAWGDSVPRGAGSWRLTAIYPNGWSDSMTAPTVSMVIRVLPTPSLPWLTKPNGPGSFATVQAPLSMASCFDINPANCVQRPVLATSYIAPYTDAVGTFRPGNTDWLRDPLTQTGTSTVVDTTTGLRRWWGVPLRTWEDSFQFPVEAVYGNAGDLGVGRRTSCAQTMTAPFGAGVRTTCYASAHGVPPGQPGFNDSTTITNPDTSHATGYILTMVIMKDANGTVFLVFPKNNQLGLTLGSQVALDTQGPKYMPHACLSCHGGTYNATTRMVDGASLLPINPGLMVFASAKAKATAEEKIRQVNAVITRSNSSAAIVAYIKELYRNKEDVPGTIATPNFVPSGWQSQAGLYRQVVRPYCATCHMAAQPSYSFSSWGNFQNSAALVRASVCFAHTMPHNELQFKEFWTKNTDPIYLPGLLVASLGFPSC